MEISPDSRWIIGFARGAADGLGPDGRMSNSRIKREASDKAFKRILTQKGFENKTLQSYGFHCNYD